jgi:hypothetical protein
MDTTQRIQIIDKTQRYFIGTQLTLFAILCGVLFDSVPPNEFIALGLGVTGTIIVLNPTVTAEPD